MEPYRESWWVFWTSKWPFKSWKFIVVCNPIPLAGVWVPAASWFGCYLPQWCPRTIVSSMLSFTRHTQCHIHVWRVVPLLLYMYMAHAASSCSWWCSPHFWWLVSVFMCSGLTLFPLRKTTRPDREMSSSVTFLTSLDLTGGVEMLPQWACIISIPPLHTHTLTESTR